MASDIANMNSLRGTTKVQDVSEAMRELWIWYGLELLAAVLKRGWGAKSAVRKTKLMRDEVTVSD